MKRALTGSLRHLAPPTLLRLLAATSPTGVLEIVTDAGSLRLEISQGRVAHLSDDALSMAARVLECHDGAFRFDPREVQLPPGETIGLAAVVGASRSHRTASAKDRFATDIDVDELLSGRIVELSRLRPENVHVLPGAPPANPIDDLLDELERTAPDELLLAQIGVATPDPRPWKGVAERAWRRRGWRLNLFRTADVPSVADLDAVVMHHPLSTTRAGVEDDWLRLVRTGVECGTPVIWVGPLGDGIWLHRLVEAGIAFVLPLPQVESGEPFTRFVDSVSRVIDRQLQLRRSKHPAELPDAVTDLVDALLHQTDPKQALGSLLQLASGTFRRSAVLQVGDTSFRCRAAFGYPISSASPALPRGFGLLERVVRAGESALGLDPEAPGSVQLAALLGVDRLPQHTAVVPLGSGGSIAGLLVGDCSGDQLPDLRELSLLARRLGGLLVQA